MNLYKQLNLRIVIHIMSMHYYIAYKKFSSIRENATRTRSIIHPSSQCFLLFFRQSQAWRRKWQTDYLGYNIKCMSTKQLISLKIKKRNEKISQYFWILTNEVSFNSTIAKSTSRFPISKIYSKRWVISFGRR